QVDRDQVLGLRVAQRHAARRDEEGVARAEARGEVAARGRHQPPVPRDAAEACDLLAEPPLLRSHRLDADGCHQAALPYAAARPRSGEPRLTLATSAATRIASRRLR